MRILIFTEGTILMHKNAEGYTREEIVKQSKGIIGLFKDQSVHKYESYIPIGNAVKKLRNWKKCGAELLYMTSRRKTDEIEQIRAVLKIFRFPQGQLLFRQKNEEYHEIVEKVIPEILVEDDCESIGGRKEMTITNVSSKIKNIIKSIPVKEFGGIDHLPDKITEL
ncbi:MAG: hypothetical protein ABIJ34_00115 [archaeon]